ncbi:hypothetical protein TNCT_318931 [Trichonephila clavata]|uniref:Uncharacterized protein n=1 Tax=Trichonephila clavata TaxID=2740835 RepID=A0A8X6GQK8_TRICU|nr:hypothetical protein TNCT_318931 [Trichonephila clavata]
MDRQALEPPVTALEDDKGSGTGTESSARNNRDPPSELRTPVVQELERRGDQARPEPRTGADGFFSYTSRLLNLGAG